MLRRIIPALALILGSSTPALSLDFQAQTRYKIQEIREEIGNCKTLCTHISLIFPYLHHKQVDAEKRMNQSINRFLQEMVPHEGKASDLQSALRLFALEHRREAQDSSDPSEWTFDLEMKPEVWNPYWVTLRAAAYTFAGGAHGNAETRFLTFDNRDGRMLSWQEAFQPGYEKALLQQAEMALRSQVELSPEADLTEHFQFKTGRFALPQQIAWGSQGLILYYNTYEIGPYAMGPTELLLSYAVLQTLLKPAFLKQIYPAESF